VSALAEAAGDAPFVFVVGKGGVGKTTAAGSLALELADAGAATHLLSTDPAHSLADLFGQQPLDRAVVSACSERLLLEEFDAAAFARQWVRRATHPVTEIVKAGTYLDDEDVAGFTRLALPGLDELMAVLRLAELADAEVRVVVDTAPTGHALRLLDAGSVHEGFAAALRAMADKAAAVASGLAGRSVRLRGEAFIEELELAAGTFHDRVLRPAAFVIITRPHAVVAAETARLAAALNRRGLTLVATVYNGTAAGAVEAAAPPAALEMGSRLSAPLLPDATGCAGLRAWREAVQPARSAAGSERSDGSAGVRVERPAAERAALTTDVGGEPALPWLTSLTARLLVFAGKGGVGKSTCAAAAALALARTRAVLLCSADPAGSLTDVLGMDVVPAGRVTSSLRVLQVEAEAQLARLRDAYRSEVLDALERVGLSEAAALDRRVIDALWDLAPPGIDEFAGLAAMLDATASDEMIVLDTAPTGHFLRLLTMPGLALDWTRQLMRIILKYRAAGVAGEAAESLLRTARELRALQELLHDESRCAVIPVTLAEPLVEGETDRLLAALQSANVPVPAVLRNLAGSAPARAGVPMITAPACEPPPVGPAALEAFIAEWKIGV
jgi:arsenite/tail-anchored protein-transporting ATPase